MRQSIDLIFTSCIFPRVFTNRKVSSPYLRANQLINSIISNLNQLKQSNALPCRCYVFEMIPSDENSLKIYKNEIKNRILEKTYEYFESVEIVDFIATTQSQEVLKKGKGYGELLLLEHYLFHYQTSSKILKISGRYEIENLSYLIHCFDKSSRSLGVCYSNLLRNAITHTYFSAPETLKKFIENAKPIIMDSAGITLEKCFFNFVKKQKDIVRINYPEPSKNTISGATGDQYLKRKNFLRKVIYNML
jgi:hypothetical protein